jgi:hypothetical protein
MEVPVFCVSCAYCRLGHIPWLVRVHTQQAYSWRLHIGNSTSNDSRLIDGMETFMGPRVVVVSSGVGILLRFGTKAVRYPHYLTRHVLTSS